MRPPESAVRVALPLLPGAALVMQPSEGLCEKIKEEAFPPGAKLVWSDKENKLLLQMPKSLSQPAPPALQQSTSTTIIDRVLGVPARQ
jgi:hypothetical protein